MSAFDEIRVNFGTKGHTKGCPVCGATNAGAVMVGLQGLGAKGSNKGGPGNRIGSRMRSFCEEHAAELFLELVAVLEKRAGIVPDEGRS